jgi:hypothetical protein
MFEKMKPMHATASQEADLRAAVAGRQACQAPRKSSASRRNAHAMI